MKKLFDETHPYAEHDRRRTQWYMLDESDGLGFLLGEPDEDGVRFLIPSDYSVLARQALSAVKSSLMDEAAKGVSETHWIFYTQLRDGDIIGDRVRFTIMLRQKGSQIDCDIHYSDFLFASAFDEIMKMKQAIIQAVEAGAK
ncbi:MAG: hypothetical protein PHG11_05000 [Eubacteriales bacterium]|nr:hypothetical protein [Eubacteriales bacterium]